jgi:probable rRNA maturation factor
MITARAAGVRGRLRVVVTDGRGHTPAAARSLATWLERFAPRAARGTVAIALVSDARMRVMNRRFRGIDRATDVLSFPADAPALEGEPRPHAPSSTPRTPRHLGDLAIALGVARRQAGLEGHELGTELRILALHGLLHLLGYDHERDKGSMRTLEERLRRRAGLPAGLIARAPRPKPRSLHR